MKKLLIVLISFLIPLTSFAAYPIVWTATSSDASFIAPNTLNNVLQALKITGVATSTINKLDVAVLNVSSGATIPASISLTSYTTGSTLFVGPSGTIAQDNANFFWDDTNNRLGIGTVTPQAALEVLGDLRLTGGGNTNIDFYDSVNTAGGPQTIAKISGQQMVNHGSGVLVFSTAFNGAPTEKMRIDRAGLIGIGTTTPSDKLGVNSSIGISAGSGGNTGYLRIISASNVNYLQSGRDNTSNSAAPLVFGTNANATEWARFTSTGSFGIGTTTPASPLAVAGSGNIISVGDANGGTTAYMSFSSGGGFANIGRGMLGFNPTSNNMTIQGAAGKGLDFNVGNSTFGSGQAMVITAAGFVGIGTTTPLRKLDIYSASSGNDYDFQLSNLFYNKGIKLGVDSANVPAIQGFIPTTGGATNLVLNAAGGNVGIGTTNPLVTLHTNTTNAASQTIFTTESDIDAVGEYNEWSNMVVGGLTYSSIRHYIQSSARGGIGFNAFNGSSNAEVMRLTGDGNVGIGSTTPTLGKLHIENTSNTANVMVAGYNGSSGSSAQAQFRLFNDGGITTGDGAAMFLTSSSYTAPYANSLGIWNYENGPVVFAANGAEKMRIETSGNVGIGTTTPAYKLDVVGDIRLTNNKNIYFDNVSGVPGSVLNYDATGHLSLQAPTAGDDLYLRIAGNIIQRLASNGSAYIGGTSAAASPKLYIDGGAGNSYYNGSGNFGVGTTTPAYAMTVATGNNGTVGVNVVGNSVNSALTPAALILNSSYGTLTGSSVSGSAGILALNSSSNGLTFGTGGSVHMTLTSTGNVGIATTTPDNKLQVVGGIESTGAYASPTGPKGVVLSSETSFDQLQSFKSRPLYINPLGNNVIFESGKLGNVGFGTTAPAVMLDVYGQIRAISPTLPTCNAAIYGAIQYDVSADNFYGCKTSGWVLLN